MKKVKYKEFSESMKPLFAGYFNHADVEKRCFISNGTLYVPEGIASLVSFGMIGD